MSTEEQTVATDTYLVTGMTCDHCARAVVGELQGLPSVTDVTVRLVPGGQSAVTVVSSAPLDTSAVSAALDEAGGYLLADAADG